MPAAWYRVVIGSGYMWNQELALVNPPYNDSKEHLEKL